MDKNIVLFGFMGTGKTSVAKALAKDLKMRFVEMDAVIEEREAMKISDIFAKKGEPYFRALEKDLVKELAKEINMVISTGGGVVLDEDNIKEFKKNGMLFCLTAPPEIIYERVKNEKHRPLLAVADPLSKIKELLAARRPFYEKIKKQIDTTNKTVEEITEEIKRMCYETD